MLTLMSGKGLQMTATHSALLSWIKQNYGRIIIKYLRDQRRTLKNNNEIIYFYFLFILFIYIFLHLFTFFINFAVFSLCYLSSVFSLMYILTPNSYVLLRTYVLLLARHMYAISTGAGHFLKFI